MFRENLKECVAWFNALNPVGSFESISPTRDVFQGRWESLLSTISSQVSGPLFSAVVAEIGFNCFDHNLGKWRNQSGCWFFCANEALYFYCVIADRGQGIRSSLSAVKSSLHADAEALKVAFEERISGRAPERRGNGLKFVRAAINGSPTRGLLCFSGKGNISIGETRNLISVLGKTTPQGSGALTLLQWDLSQ